MTRHDRLGYSSFCTWDGRGRGETAPMSLQPDGPLPRPPSTILFSTRTMPAICPRSTCDLPAIYLRSTCDLPAICPRSAHTTPLSTTAPTYTTNSKKGDIIITVIISLRIIDHPHGYIPGPYRMPDATWSILTPNDASTLCSIGQ